MTFYGQRRSFDGFARFFGICSFIAIACMTSGCGDAGDQETTATAAESITGNEIASILSAHNFYRARHGAAPLVWSSQLENRAQSWANGCQIRHSTGAFSGFGENIANGWGGFNRTAQQVVDFWYKEVSQYNYAQPGFSQATGHFTQIVWKASTQLGCGHAVCGIQDFWVCQYDPPGNRTGMFPQNVSPAQ